MDIEQAKTFLEIVRAGSFIAAARGLHVTQTTVTARVRNLEQQLGCRLFVRNRSGARLTPDGERFVSHAGQLVSAWENAKRELPLPTGTRQTLILGAENSLWQPLLLRWANLLRQQKPDIALRLTVGERDQLQEQLQQGAVDAALLHQPLYWPGTQVEQLLEEKLIQVCTTNKKGPYVYVDWGEHFRHQHDTALPHLARSGLTIDFGPMALIYILEHGGSGYFRTRVVQPYLDRGLLNPVVDAPEFTYPVYVMHPRGSDSPLLSAALAVLHESVLVPPRMV